MLVVRLLLAMTLALGVAALALVFITGNQAYLRYLARALLGLMLLGLLWGIGVVAGRLLGVLL